MDSLFLDSSVTVSDEDALTVQQIVETLEKAWLNEKFSPDLLPQQSEIIDCMLEQISGMEENLETLEKTDLRVEIHRLELERIRYILSSYLRSRLEKIEEYCSYVVAKDDERDPEEKYMTRAERQFAEKYQNNFEQHFRTVLRHVPPMNHYEGTVMNVVPNFNSYVFFRVRTTIEGIILEGMDSADEPITLVGDSQHIAIYNGIASLVKDGSVQLI